MKAIAHRAMLLTSMRLALVVAVMTWGGLTPPALANPADGTISGTYAAMLPAFYLRNSVGYTHVCIEVSGSDSTATGMIKALRHDGTLQMLATSPPLPLSGATDRGREQCNFPAFANVSATISNGNLVLTRPVNWCGRSEVIKNNAVVFEDVGKRYFDNSGWDGRLTMDSEHLRVRVNNRFLKMHGSRWLKHGDTCDSLLKAMRM